MALQGEQDEDGVQQGQQRERPDARCKLVVVPISALELHLRARTCCIGSVLWKDDGLAQLGCTKLHVCEYVPSIYLPWPYADAVRRSRQLAM